MAAEFTIRPVNALRRLSRFVARVAQDSLAHPLHLTISVIALSIGALSVALTVVLGGLASEVFVAKAEQRTARAITFGSDIVKIDPQVTWGASSSAYLEGFRRRGANAIVLGEVPFQVQNGSSLIPIQDRVYWGNYADVRRIPAVEGVWPPSQGIYPPAVAVSAKSSWKINDVLPLVSAAGGTPVAVRVVGRVADGLDEPEVYIPGGVCEGLFSCELNNSRLLVHGIADQASVASGASSFRGLSFGDWSRVDETASIMDQIATLKNIFLACSIVALFVSVLGMLNLGLSTIEHRSRELSVRRALGVTNSENVGLVIGGAVLTGVLGALFASLMLALVIFVVLPRTMSQLSGVQLPGFPWGAVGAALLASELTAGLAAVAPALVAGRVEISSVLRG